MSAELTIRVFVALLLILLATMLCGSLARRVGQPRVLGEMVAGVLLGPSLFGWLFPGLHAEIFPPAVRSVIYLLSMLGLVLFMFLVGAAIPTKMISRSLVRAATTVGATGVVLPFVLGFGVAWLVSEQITEPGTPRVQIALLLGAALSVTSFPMLAKMIAERGLEHSRLGSMTLLAASFDDAVAWVLLAIAVAMATGGSAAGVVLTLLGGFGFVVVMLTLGRRALRPLARHVERRGEITPNALLIILIVVLGAATVTDLLGLHFAFGAFVAGVSLPHSVLLRMQLKARFTDLTVGLLLPMFFVYTGLNTRLAGLSDPGMTVPLVLIMVVAFVGKYVGCAAVLRMQGHSWRRASAIGGLMNARGLMVLIFANAAADVGMVNTDLFTILVLVAVVTSAAAIPIFRLSLSPAMEDAERGEGEPPHPRAHSTEHALSAMPERSAVTVAHRDRDEGRP